MNLRHKSNKILKNIIKGTAIYFNISNHSCSAYFTNIIIAQQIRGTQVNTKRILGLLTLHLIGYSGYLYCLR